jgi:hypothetical protein
VKTHLPVEQVARLNGRCVSHAGSALERPHFVCPVVQAVVHVVMKMMKEL